MSDRILVEDLKTGVQRTVTRKAYMALGPTVYRKIGPAQSTDSENIPNKNIKPAGVVADALPRGSVSNQPNVTAGDESAPITTSEATPERPQPQSSELPGKKRGRPRKNQISSYD